MRITTRIIVIAFAAALLAAPPIRADLNSGLVAYYPFNGNANDASGNGNTGSPQNGATFTSDRSGNLNSAGSFDGVNDFIQVPNSTSLNISGSSPTTISLWAYRTGSAATMHMIGKRENCGTTQYQMGFDPVRGLQFGGNNPGLPSTNVNQASTGIQLPMNDWTHLVGVFDGTQFRFYINGQLRGTGTGTLGPAMTQGIKVGDSGTCGNYFAGSIDDVRIYNRALSAAEIQQLFGQTAACAQTWTPVYQTDFSTNPGWMANSPSHDYWDSATQTYHYYNDKLSDEWAYLPVTYSAQNSYRLQYDIMPTRCDWAANARLGLWDSDMTNDQATEWFVGFHRVDSGQTASLFFWDSQGNHFHPGGAQPAPFSVGTWYRVEAIYDHCTGTLTLTVRNRSTGALVGTQTLTSVGTFSGIARLGLSNVGDKYAAGAVAEGYIDNLILSMSQGPQRPVIVLPGAGASRLCADGYSCALLTGTGWPADVANNPSGSPANLQFSQNGEPLAGISAALRPNSILDGFYDPLVDFLIANGYERDATLFEFPYDFRHSVTALADQLAVFIEQVRSQTGAEKVDLIAHSMGGLVAKQYLADTGSSSHINTCLLMGTPNLGAPKALAVLRYGEYFFDGFPGLVLSNCKLKHAGHNWPGGINLLPGSGYFQVVGRYYDDETVADGTSALGLLDFNGIVTDLKTAQEHGACLLTTGDPAPRLALSTTLVDTEMKDFHANLDYVGLPDDVQIYVVAGWGVSTMAKIIDQTRLDSTTLCSISLEFTTQGDGTVPLKSAEYVPSDQTYYVNLGRLSQSHMKMMAPIVVQKLVLNLLRGQTLIVDPDMLTSISTTRPTTFSRTTKFSTCSPVNLSVYDSVGNHTGLLADESVETGIPGSKFEKIDHQQFVVMPEGDTYMVVVDGVAQGSFTLLQTDADSDGQALRTLTWLAVPVANGSQDTLASQFGAVNPALEVDVNGDGTVDYQLPPDADGDRVPDVSDHCPNTPLGAIVNANGCSIDQVIGQITDFIAYVDGLNLKKDKEKELINKLEEAIKKLEDSQEKLGKNKDKDVQHKREEAIHKLEEFSKKVDELQKQRLINAEAANALRAAAQAIIMEIAAFP